MGLLNEFKEFATRGNVVDLAVGIIVGGAFGKIVSSLVADIIMPPIGLLVGGVRFTDLKFWLRNAVTDSRGNIIKEAVTINIGNFIQSVFDFLIIAGSIFLLVKLMNRLNRKKSAESAAPPAPREEVELLTEIRDLLKYSQR
ncbi:large conductance mechanosensitive channel protein [Desulfosporosinus acidiphilus SJ4]|uniref:Large-conductance mechanosensitive channel n=1 Tax=Desulfosporosinus acidiphilus (strain DSM 22704 / JCM 16185 / SJ4) TaxID=646529 RepID=I4D4K8_DESAJ|nr:large-conductance mechanosensitive channel protein MscL [Desulfosporosinus acidiphilus]AFM40732.1 large conductance mechanosensitive channel protein [Desulfosporosinus acidiphilus SJ4]